MKKHTKDEVLRMSLRTVQLILILSSSTCAFNILVLFPTAAYSHQRVITVLTERLVQKGHKLFVVSPNAVHGIKNTNYTFVDVSFSYKLVAEELKDDASRLQEYVSKWHVVSAFKPFAVLPIRQFLSEQFIQFKRWVELEKIKFDVVIIESYQIPSTCAMARLLTGGTAPIISISTFSVDYYAEDYSLGSIMHLSYVPSIFDPFTNKMTIWQKLENWFTHHYITSGLGKGREDAARAFFKETYGPEGEAFEDECWTNISLTLIASNFMYFYSRPLAPNVIELGPMHIRPPDKLPKNLQDWLDGAEKGVIYFSLGSNIKTESLPAEVLHNLLKFFRELPPGYRVLWKRESDEKIPGQSDNILCQKWLPQQSVLAHPKVKVFIMQGGLQSFQEAVHYGVPLVGIPGFFDQESNVAKIVDDEIGVRLRRHELHSFEKVKTAFEAVLYDDRYTRNMKKLSAISHDFTSQALDKAVFWVEHVARHGGASHLRPSTGDTTYFQFFCLDIISVILVLSFFILYILYLMSKLLILNVLLKPHLKVKKS